MENNEQKRAEIREMSSGLVRGIKMVKAMADVDGTGDGDLVIDVLIEELEKLRKKPEPEQGDTCQEGPGVCMCTCDAAPRKDMTFGNALDALKAGYSVARKGWNGKNQYVELATCISYKGNAGEIVNVHHNNIGNKALAFVGTSGVQMGWLASQADMLADDWYIVE